MISLSDGIPARGFPCVDVAAIVADFAVAALRAGAPAVVAVARLAGGVAFYAQVGGFVFGYLGARLVAGAASSSVIRATDGAAAQIV